VSKKKNDSCKLPGFEKNTYLSSSIKPCQSFRVKMTNHLKQNLLNNMKNLFLLFALVIAFQTSGQAQSLIWESSSGARIRNNPAVGDAINNSNLSPSNFDNDGFGDVVILSIYRDSLFFRINTSDIEYLGHLDTDWPEEDVVFLGFAEDPHAPGQGDPDFNPLLFGRQQGNRIIGVLVAFKSPGSNQFEAITLERGFSYAFLSIDDFDDDNISEIFLYNLDEKKVQLWQF